MPLLEHSADPLAAELTQATNSTRPFEHLLRFLLVVDRHNELSPGGIFAPKLLAMVALAYSLDACRMSDEEFEPAWESRAQFDRLIDQQAAVVSMYLELCVLAFHLPFSPLSFSLSPISSPRKR